MEHAIAQVDGLIARLCEETSSSSYKLYLTGSNNFRYKINPEYKANRKEQERPKWLEHLREHVVIVHNATVSDGCEADDLMGIAQTNCHQSNTESIIISLDKDMLQIEGNHYSWEISGLLKDGNRWVKEAQRNYTTPEQGLRYFYGQLLLGDKADNIFGFDGLARTKVPQKLEWMFQQLEELSSEDEMYNFVLEQYDSEERLIMNGQCLFIQTYEGQIWQPPKKDNIILDNGV